MAITNIAVNDSDDPDYFTFVNSLLADFNKAEALLHGLGAIVERQHDGPDIDGVYAGELLRLAIDQLAAMRYKLDESTFSYVQTAA